MARRIALVEDDPTIRQNYAEALQRAGYDVTAFGDRPSASKSLAARLPELAIIDIGLGADVDGGFELCRELRAAGNRLPIIFLTAGASDLELVSALRVGPDDYLTKDVSLPHLLARIAALFRRLDALSAAPAAEDTLARGPLALDVKRMSARWNGSPVELTVTEFWIVHSLARLPGHVKSREQLMRDANMVVDEGTITSHVKRIRKKIGAVDARFDAIESVYGMGYRWRTEGAA